LLTLLSKVLTVGHFRMEIFHLGLT